MWRVTDVVLSKNRQGPARPGPVQGVKVTLAAQGIVAPGLVSGKTTNTCHDVGLS